VNILKIMILIVISGFSLNAYAALDCGNVVVKNLTVQAERENGSLFANTMRIHVANTGCAGVTYAYLENGDDAYSSTLAVLMAAQAQGKKVRLFVKNNPGIYKGAYKIEWVIIN